MSQQHIIHHVTLDLKVESGDDSLDTANQLIDEYKSIILQTIEDVLEDFDTDVYILIDRLDISVGEVKSLEELIQKLEQQLRGNINHYLHAISLSSNDQDEFINLYEANAKTGYPTRSDFLYFLAHGEFEWDYHKKIFNDKNNFSYFEELLNQYITKVDVEEFLNKVKSSPNLIFRILYYFPSFKDLIVQLLLPSWYSLDSPSYSYVMYRLKAQFNLLIEARVVTEVRSFFEVFQFIHQQKNTPNLLLVLLWLVDSVKEIKTLADFVIASNIDLIKSMTVSENRINISQEIQTLTGITIKENELYNIFNVIHVEFRLNKSDIYFENEMHPETRLFDKDVNTKNLKYCGILFLHPYLLRLFEKYGLLDGKVFKSLQSKIKAVRYLFYLATFKTEGEEDDFLFLKLLVGLEAEYFIEPTFDLSYEEKVSCKELLQQLITEWNVLKSTSVETIQHNFLQRNGVLHVTDRTWDLHLEKSAFDILLDHFPYNYSLIKLKWIEKIICVVL